MANSNWEGLVMKKLFFLIVLAGMASVFFSGCATVEMVDVSPRSAFLEKEKNQDREKIYASIAQDLADFKCPNPRGFEKSETRLFFSNIFEGRNGTEEWLKKMNVLVENIDKKIHIKKGEDPYGGVYAGKRLYLEVLNGDSVARRYVIIEGINSFACEITNGEKIREIGSASLYGIRGTPNLPRIILNYGEIL